MVQQEEIREVIGNEDFISIVNLMKNTKPFPHTIIHGPSGAGKTTLGKYISRVTDSDIEQYYGPDMDKFQLSMIFGGIEEHTIIVIDEIHALNKTCQEIIYQPIEECIYKGSEMPPFTLIGITTDLNALPDALIRRFRLQHRVQLYTTQELMNVVLGLLKKEFDDSAVESIAMMSRGSPGVARNHLELIEGMFPQQLIDFEQVEQYQKLRHINDIGLEDVDIEYMKCLRAYDVLALSTLSSVLIEREKTIEEIIEPYLYRLAFVMKTSKGRQLTRKGERYLDKLMKENKNEKSKE